MRTNFDMAFMEMWPETDDDLAMDNVAVSHAVRPASGHKLALSRRAAFGLAAGAFATLASSDQGLRNALLPDRRVQWDEISPSPAKAAMTAIPRRLSHPSRHGPAALADWGEFKRRFVGGDGRVCDNGNGGVAHSEGQGWGLLLSVAFDDMASFDTILDWTRRNLQVRSDALHAWRYIPNVAVAVSDHNNATDGDLFIAAALWRAAWRWQRPQLADSAREIVSDILDKLVLEVGGRTILLPGAVGFERARSITVNPSYYVLPIFDELAALTASPKWQALRAHGLELIRDGRFGPWRLPPDWLQVDRDTGALSPDAQRPARFSYDAIRVPLWMSWAGKAGGAPTQDFLSYWRRFQPNPPAWVDLSNNQMAPYPASPGMIAVGHVAAGLGAAATDGNEMSLIPRGVPVLSASIDYYSAALTLLARCVWQESCNA